MGALEPDALDRTWRTRLVVGLFALTLACIAVSLVSFRLRWGVWPEPGSVGVGLTLLAPIALPMSVGELLGIRAGLPLAWAVAGSVGCWSVVSALIWRAARARSVVSVVLLALLSLLASIHWHGMVEGMLGI